MADKEKPKVNIDDLTDSSLTPDEQESIKGGVYTTPITFGSIGGGGLLGGGLSAKSEPPVSNGKDFSTNLGTKDADEDVD